MQPIPESQQFFGSTVERFIHGQPLKHQKSNSLGPGQYNVTSFKNGTLDKLKGVKQNKAGFSTSIARFKDEKKGSNLGPGYYEFQTPQQSPDKKDILAGAFGSTEKRFNKSSLNPDEKEKSPGPGDYKAERSIDTLKNLRAMNIRKSTSMFLSNSNRIDCYDLKKKAPDVGSYNINHNDIGEQLRKQVELDNNAVKANIKSRPSGGQPFISGTKRFGPQRKVDDNEAYLGPGYYEHITFIDKASNLPAFKKNKIHGNVRIFSNMKGGAI